MTSIRSQKRVNLLMLRRYRERITCPVLEEKGTDMDSEVVPCFNISSIIEAARSTALMRSAVSFNY
jgi:hypothetical protein